VSAKSKATVTAPNLKRWRAVSRKKHESQTTDQECDPRVTSWKEEQRRWEIAKTAKCPHRPRNIASIGLSENHLRYNISMLGNQLCAMVDSGASRNFLSTKVVKRIGVQQRKLARAYTAVVANGGKLKVTSHATLDITFDGKLTIPVYFHIIDTPHDVLLGIPFLQRYLPQLAWREGTMRLVYGGVVYHIPAVSAPTRTEEGSTSTTKRSTSAVVKKHKLPEATISAQLNALREEELNVVQYFFAM